MSESKTPSDIPTTECVRVTLTLPGKLKQGRGTRQWHYGPKQQVKLDLTKFANAGVPAFHYSDLVVLSCSPVDDCHFQAALSVPNANSVDRTFVTALRAAGAKVEPKRGRVAYGSLKNLRYSVTEKDLNDLLLEDFKSMRINIVKTKFGDSIGMATFTCLEDDLQNLIANPPSFSLMNAPRKCVEIYQSEMNFCFKCHDTGHFARACPVGEEKEVCRKCHQGGHSTADCKRKLECEDCKEPHMRSKCPRNRKDKLRKKVSSEPQFEVSVSAPVMSASVWPELKSSPAAQPAAQDSKRDPAPSTRDDQLFALLSSMSKKNDANAAVINASLDRIEGNAKRADQRIDGLEAKINEMADIVHRQQKEIVSLQAQLKPKKGEPKKAAVKKGAKKPASATAPTPALSADFSQLPELSAAVSPQVPKFGVPLAQPNGDGVSSSSSVTLAGKPNGDGVSSSSSVTFAAKSPKRNLAQTDFPSTSQGRGKKQLAAALAQDAKNDNPAPIDLPPRPSTPPAAAGDKRGAKSQESPVKPSSKHRQTGPKADATPKQAEYDSLPSAKAVAELAVLQASGLEEMEDDASVASKPQ